MEHEGVKFSVTNSVFILISDVGKHVFPSHSQLSSTPLFLHSRQNCGRVLLIMERGDRERGQIKGLTTEEGRRGGAQTEAGNGEDLKGGK